MTATGFYHCSAKPVGRAKGRSIVATAAYRAGERLIDETTGLIHAYEMRHGVADAFIITRADAPSWAQDRQRLWNDAEHVEKRANGRLATELELALPSELSPEARKALVMEFVRPIVEKHGVAVDIAIHEPGKSGDHRNHHAHVLFTHREIGPDGFGEIANRHMVEERTKGKNGKWKTVQRERGGVFRDNIDAWRLEWEQHVNRAYEHAGLDIRVDHRSHKDRGIELEPTIHLGPAAAAMERDGQKTDRGDINRAIEAANERQLAEQAREAAAIKAQLEPSPTSGPWDRDADNRAWETAVADAATARLPVLDAGLDARAIPDPAPESGPTFEPTAPTAEQIARQAAEAARRPIGLGDAPPVYAFAGAQKDHQTPEPKGRDQESPARCRTQPEGRKTARAWPWPSSGAASGLKRA